MITALTGYFKKHSRKFATIGVITGGCYLLSKYLQYKIADFEEKALLERSAKENIKRRFIQNQLDSDNSILSSLSLFSDQLAEKFQVEELAAQIKRIKIQQTSLENEVSGLSQTPTFPQDATSLHPTTLISDNGLQGQSKEKTIEELWEEVKIQTISRTISSVYLLSLLTMLNRIQLNLLGRHIYLDSLSQPLSPLAGQADGFFGFDFEPHRIPSRPHLIPWEVERDFLTFSWFLLNVGWKNIADLVQLSVREVFSTVSLKEKISSERLNEALSSVRRNVEQDRGGLNCMKEYLLPTEEGEIQVLRHGGVMMNEGSPLEPKLALLLNETRDILDSPNFSKTLQHTLDNAFSLLRSKLDPYFSSVSRTNVEASDMIEERCAVVAALLPQLSRNMYAILNPSSNEYLQMISDSPYIQSFSAIIYTSYE